MAFSRTSLKYGLIIRAWPLLVATRAFLQIQPLLLAFDVILFRKNAGTLEIHESAMKAVNFGDIPEEILQVISKKIFELAEMDNAAEDLVQETLQCHEYQVESGDPDQDIGEWFTRYYHHTQLSPDGWEEISVSGECDLFEELAIDMGRGELLEHICGSALLDYYGLEADSEPTFEEGDHYDLNLYYAAVSISQGLSSLINSSAEAEESGNTSAAQYVKFSTKIFKSFDTDLADRRLLRLIKDWNLE